MSQRIILSTLALVLCFAAAGCSGPFAPTVSSPPPSLPSSWYLLPENAQALSPSASELAAPTAAMTRSIQTQFRAHTEALSQVDVSTVPAAVSAAGGAAGMVPWHLDGMIANFTVTVNGIFGALLTSGTATVRGTWQQKTVSAHSPPGRVPGSHHLHLQISSSLTDKGLNRILEPTVRAAVATRSIENEAAFRSTLRAHGAEFLQLARVLQGVPVRPGWHVDGLQLQLTFTAQGQVTPVLGVGGSLNVYLDWQKSPGPTTPGAIRQGPLFESVAAFAEAMSAALPDAILESREIRTAGFTLDQFQVGVAVLGGATIGISQVQGALNGKIIFKKNGVANLASLEFSDSPGVGSVFLVQKNEADRLPSVPLANVLSGGHSDEAFSLREVPLETLKKGLRDALHMGSFFVKNAKAADTAQWRVTQIETEFDASLGGAIRLASLLGQGQFVLDFDRVEK